MDFIDQDWEDHQHGPHRPGFDTPHGPMDGPGFGRPHGKLDRPPMSIRGIHDFED